MTVAAMLGAGSAGCLDITIAGDNNFYSHRDTLSERKHLLNCLVHLHHNAHRTSHATSRISQLTCHSSRILHYTLSVTRHTSNVACLTSYLSPHKSHVTWHMPDAAIHAFHHFVCHTLRSLHGSPSHSRVVAAAAAMRCSHRLRSLRAHELLVTRDLLCIQ
jgi:hypothetical protein